MKKLLKALFLILLFIFFSDSSLSYTDRPQRERRYSRFDIHSNGFIQSNHGPLGVYFVS